MSRRTPAPAPAPALPPYHLKNNTQAYLKTQIKNGNHSYDFSEVETKDTLLKFNNGLIFNSLGSYAEIMCFPE